MLACRRGQIAVAVVVVCLLAATLSSCLARRRLITRRGSSGKNVSLQVADRTALTGEIVRQYNTIHDFNATVDMTPALGSAEKNHITEYKDVRAYILFRKPAQIRLVGLFPVVRNKAFDMVSDGLSFKLYLPTRNRFITGRNSLEQPSQNKLENLRPQHFVEAMLVRPIDPNAKVLFENYTDEDNAYYILHEVHEAPGGELRLSRTIWFNRLDLGIARQLIFDDAGNILTDARYSNWRAYDNVGFPKHVEIDRPHDEYGVVIDIVKMDVNKGVADDRFTLEQPDGVTLAVVGQPAGPAPVPQKKQPPSKGTPRKK